MKKVVAFLRVSGKVRSSHETSGRTHKMTTYQRELLDKLIAELTNNNATNWHAAQMIAAELKGAMQSSIADLSNLNPNCENCVSNAISDLRKQAPDADGWVENTGAMPECEIIALKFGDGEIAFFPQAKESSYFYWGENTTITHYRPA